MGDDVVVKIKIDSETKDLKVIVQQLEEMGETASKSSDQVKQSGRKIEQAFSDVKKIVQDNEQSIDRTADAYYRLKQRIYASGATLKSTSKALDSIGSSSRGATASVNRIKDSLSNYYSSAKRAAAASDTISKTIRSFQKDPTNAAKYVEVLSHSFARLNDAATAMNMDLKQAKQLLGTIPKTAATQADLDKLATSFQKLGNVSQHMKTIRPAMNQTVSAVKQTANAINTAQKQALQEYANSFGNINKVQGNYVDSTGRVVSSTREGADSIRHMENYVRKTGITMSKTTETIRSFTYSILAIDYALRVLVKPIMFFKNNIIDVQIEFENLQTGIASTIAALYDYQDAQGNIIEGPMKFMAAQRESQQIFEELRRANIETAATLPELTAGFQNVLAYSKDLNLTMSQSVDIAKLIAQAIKASGLPMEQISSETRSLLKGEQDRDATLTRILNINSEDLNIAKQKGQVYEYLVGKLGDYELATEAIKQNWEGVLSNLEDTLKEIANASFQETSEEAKALLNYLREFLQDNKERIIELVEEYFPRLVQAVMQLGAAFGAIAGVTVTFGKIADVSEEVGYNIYATMDKTINKTDELGESLADIGRRSSSISKISDGLINIGSVISKQLLLFESLKSIVTGNYNVLFEYVKLYTAFKVGSTIATGMNVIIGLWTKWRQIMNTANKTLRTTVSLTAVLQAVQGGWLGIVKGLAVAGGAVVAYKTMESVMGNISDKVSTIKEYMDEQTTELSEQVTYLNKIRNQYDMLTAQSNTTILTERIKKLNKEIEKHQRLLQSTQDTLSPTTKFYMELGGSIDSIIEGYQKQIAQLQKQLNETPHTGMGSITGVSNIKDFLRIQELEREIETLKKIQALEEQISLKRATGKDYTKDLEHYNKLLDSFTKKTNKTKDEVDKLNYSVQDLLDTIEREQISLLPDLEREKAEVNKWYNDIKEKIEGSGLKVQFLSEPGNTAQEWEAIMDELASIYDAKMLKIAEKLRQKEMDALQNTLQEMAKLREKGMEEIDGYQDKIAQLEMTEVGYLERTKQKMIEQARERYASNEQIQNKLIPTINKYYDLQIEKAEKAAFLSSKLGQTMTQLETTFTSAFEEAIIGGENFSSMLQGLANDIARIILRIHILAPLMNSVFGVGGIVGGLFSPSTPSNPVTVPTSPIPTSTVGVAHKGGIIGIDPLPKRTVSSALFDNAPRLHNGLMPDEYPAILQRGEMVIPANKVGSGSINVQVNINNQGTPMQIESQTQRTNADGTQVIDITVKSALERMASDGRLDSVLAPYTTRRQVTY